MGLGVISLRALLPSDIDAVVELERENQPQPWTEGILEGELSAKDRSYVAAEDAEIVGYGGVMVVGEEAHVTNLLVAPAHRRNGIARQILSRLVRDAVDMGARHLTLEVRAGNEPARRLYHRFGLAPVGIRPGYYQGEDALIMWAHDIDTPEYLRSLG